MSFIGEGGTHATQAEWHTQDSYQGIQEDEEASLGASHSSDVDELSDEDMVLETDRQSAELPSAMVSHPLPLENPLESAIVNFVCAQTETARIEEDSFLGKMLDHCIQIPHLWHPHTVNQRLARHYADQKLKSISKMKHESMYIFLTGALDPRSKLQIKGNWLSTDFEPRSKDLGTVDYSASLEETANHLWKFLRQIQMDDHVCGFLFDFVDSTQSSALSHYLHQQFKPQNRFWIHSAFFHDLLQPCFVQVTRILDLDCIPFTDLTIPNPFVDEIAFLIEPWQRVAQEFRPSVHGNLASLGPLIMDKLQTHLDRYKERLLILKLDQKDLKTLNSLYSCLEEHMSTLQHEMYSVGMLPCLLDPWICRIYAASKRADFKSMRRLLLETCLCFYRQHSRSFENDEQLVQEEVDTYWDTVATIESAIGSFEFWKRHHQHFPLLSALAQKHLSVIVLR